MTAVDRVRDAVDYVSYCVWRDHYRVDDDGAGCSMWFVWEVADGGSIAGVRLREGFVPAALYDLLDRRGTPEERPGFAGHA